MKLVFATGNQNKLKEVKAMLPKGITLLSLKDIDSEDDIPETGATVAENASIKARYVSDKFGMDCFADDTGLEVEALGGRPGVYSARYAGPACDPADNILKLLTELKGETNRRARFITVIALRLGEKEYLFEGIVNGRITESGSGTGGFGYDPVFVPDGYTQTFAEMTSEEKNNISHRGIAVKELVAFLSKINSEF
ncbi:MAG: non-canonical purine NTP diphosphatase [Bacteroidia bacterium]